MFLRQKLGEGLNEHAFFSAICIAAPVIFYLLINVS